MNKVVTVNLNGNAYQVEESAYDILRAYLDSAARTLAANPDREEILADIEQAIADKFRATLGPNRTVVPAREVSRIISEMGPVDDGSGGRGAAEPGETAAGAASATTGPAAPAGEPKRLYLLHEGAMLGGVCNGFAAYFGIDVTILRVVVAILTLLALCAGHFGALFFVAAYIALCIILPSANTPEQKAAAQGLPKTAQEFIRRAKEGYYEGMKGFRDKRAYREWKRKFRRDMRGWSRNFQREMREHTRKWSDGWHNHWANHPRPPIGAMIAMPILALVSTALLLAAVLCVLSLLFTGAIFGVALPHTVPLWIAIVAVIFLSQIVLAPFKAMRHSYYSPYFLWDSIIWAAAVIFLVWVLNHHVPQAHHALHDLLIYFRQVGDSIKEWWRSR